MSLSPRHIITAGYALNHFEEMEQALITRLAFHPCRDIGPLPWSPEDQIVYDTLADDHDGLHDIAVFVSCAHGDWPT